MKIIKPGYYIGKCDFCNEEKQIKDRPDPFLYDAYGKTKIVKICNKCHYVRSTEV